MLHYVQVTQLIANQRQQPAGRVRVALTQGALQLGDVVVH
jgi:hypothetical protein